MNLLQVAIFDNKVLLQELAQLLNRIHAGDKNFYNDNLEVLNSITIGAHVRHILEHYQIFFKALDIEVPINYDSRERCTGCQNCAKTAIDVIQELVKELESMSPLDNSVEVSLITNPSLKDMVSQSSILREMQFLQSHTVHHLAIIGIALRQKGFTVDGNMTKAPSTRQFESSAS
ncbi:hypothetical protein [Kangiella sp. HZ709]|uniref:hypothetical protein n=1 Tax=Kangiella sp. HZ709 TaxID=2666328 RepID=UPI0012AF97F9|nr:hypothetical protein [Kangiella sp. HZ709]MRX27055.1 hypothetical protein [Kangiella sp. HZ709]